MPLMREDVGTSPERELSGEKADRIVDAMRASVAGRGVTASTFDQVSREAGVSRGLLHYYFGTKERLLVEVLRRDAEIRIEMLDRSVAPARTADEVVNALVAGAEDLFRNDPGFYTLLFELFIVGRSNPEVRRELAEVYARAREHVADVLRRKEAEGVLRLRFEAEACVTHMFAAADGGALQRLTDPGRDYSPVLAVGEAVARFLLSSAPTRA